MSKLIGNNTNTGLHNREYFFTFVVTNNAFLRTVDHVDILVDESAPVKGVVREGVFGEKDIDFTEENNTFINWDGFVDHESGILLYKVTLSPWCLKLEEMLNGVNNDSIVVINTTENSARIYFPKEGTFISSVIAFNNAGEPSDVACSDGITYDLSPIEIFNFTGFKFTTGQGVMITTIRFLYYGILQKFHLEKLPNALISVEIIHFRYLFTLYQAYTISGPMKLTLREYVEKLLHLSTKKSIFHLVRLMLSGNTVVVNLNFKTFMLGLDSLSQNISVLHLCHSKKHQAILDISIIILGCEVLKDFGCT